MLGARRNLHFNYRIDRSTKWEAPALQARYGYSVRLPTAGQNGTAIQLANKQSAAIIGAKKTRR